MYKTYKNRVENFQNPFAPKSLYFGEMPFIIAENLTIMPQYWIAFKDNVEANFLSRHSSRTSNFSVQSFIGCARGCESESTQKKKLNWICQADSVIKFWGCDADIISGLFYDASFHQFFLVPCTSRHWNLLDLVKNDGRDGLRNWRDFFLLGLPGTLVSTCLQRPFHLHSAPDT